MIAPCASFSFKAIDELMISLRLTSPMFASRIGISNSLNNLTIASREPKVSALTKTPSSSVLMVISSISFNISSSTFSLSLKTLSGEPETTSSKLGAAILIPAAATTSSNFWNFFLESLISSNGSGLKMDLILVVNTSFEEVIKAISSLVRKTPS